MCGRFSLFNFSIDKIKLTSINNENVINYNSNYNICPSDYTPALYSFKDQLYISYMKWGITPKFTNKQTVKKNIINARFDNLHIKPTFKSLINNRRCIIISTGYYEWKKNSITKQPYFIHSNFNYIYIAGLWNYSIDNKKQYVIITKKSNECISTIHDRMPLILNINDCERWLNPKEDYFDIINNYSKNLKFDYYPISSYVNSSRNNSSLCIEPFTEE